MCLVMRVEIQNRDQNVKRAMYSNPVTAYRWLTTYNAIYMIEVTLQVTIDQIFLSHKWRKLIRRFILIAKGRLATFIRVTVSGSHL